MTKDPIRMIPVYKAEQFKKDDTMTETVTLPREIVEEWFKTLSTLQKNRPSHVAVGAIEPHKLAAREARNKQFDDRLAIIKAALE